MREIKFRVWDDYNKTMSYVGQIEWKDGILQHVLRNRYNEYTLSDISKPILMQYTGLKDKNGKEIYEGDILVTGLCVHNCIVIFERGSFNLQTIEKDTQYLNNTFWNKSKENEIIGNIYENHKLLKNNG